MEMTPGQIMEAEISASTLGLEDDDTVQPQEPATSSSSLRLQGHVHPDQDHLGSDTLPEDLFTSDVNQPPSPAAAAIVQAPLSGFVARACACMFEASTQFSCDTAKASRRG